MKLNWKIRMKNKTFWATLSPAIVLIIICGLELLGFEFQISNIEEKISKIIESIFLILTILGIVNDPTTQGLSDSSQAMTYEEPKIYEEE